MLLWVWPVGGGDVQYLATRGSTQGIYCMNVWYLYQIYHTTHARVTESKEWILDNTWGTLDSDCKSGSQGLPKSEHVLFITLICVMWQ